MLDNPTDKELEAIQIVIDYLDDMMVKAPNRDMANCSNFLQKVLDEAE